MNGFMAFVFLLCLGLSMDSVASNLELGSALSNSRKEQQESYRKMKAFFGETVLSETESSSSDLDASFSIHLKKDSKRVAASEQPKSR